MHKRARQNRAKLKYGIITSEVEYGLAFSISR
ncbi:MAG: hypothetical protein ACI974_002103, partial [Paraglaciecola sp.]